MITYICLYWVGLALGAPAWYNTLLFVGVFIKILNYGMTMYKVGKKAAPEN